MTTLSVRLPDELADQLGLLAIEEALEDVGNNGLTDHSEVKEWVKSWDTPSGTAAPKCG